MSSQVASSCKDLSHDNYHHDLKDLLLQVWCDSSNAIHFAHYSIMILYVNVLILKIVPLFHNHELIVHEYSLILA